METPTAIERDLSILFSRYAPAGRQDERLSLLFACCHPDIPEEQQMPLILHILSGFHTADIAKAFSLPEDTVSRRLQRALTFFQRDPEFLEQPAEAMITRRADAVIETIYQLFYRSFYAAAAEEQLRRHLLEEVLSLGRLLAENTLTRRPSAYALLAWMCLLGARSATRFREEEELLRLKQADRSNWDQELVQQGIEFLHQAAIGNELSTYHLEGAIAYELCSAQSYETINWANVLQYYQWLCEFHPTGVYRLNRIVALLQLDGAEAALKALKAYPAWETEPLFFDLRLFLGFPS